MIEKLNSIRPALATIAILGQPPKGHLAHNNNSLVIKSATVTARRIKAFNSTFDHC